MCAKITGSSNRFSIASQLGNYANGYKKSPFAVWDWEGWENPEACVDITCSKLGLGVTLGSKTDPFWGAGLAPCQLENPQEGSGFIVHTSFQVIFI